MVKINALQRKYLESIGVLVPVGGLYYQQMTVCNKDHKSKSKKYYINDELLVYINPTLYREKMKRYMSKWAIDNMIRRAAEVIRNVKDGNSVENVKDAQSNLSDENEANKL